MGRAVDAVRTIARDRSVTYGFMTVMNKLPSDADASATPVPRSGEAPVDLAFLVGMAHELRTPLSAMSGYTELLALGINGPLSAAQLDAVKRIQRNQRLLVRLIASALSYANITTGDVTFKPRPVELAALMRRALEPLDGVLQERGLTVEFTDGAGARVASDALSQHRVDVDADHGADLVTALLMDTIDAAAAGSRIELRVGAANESVSVQLRSDGAPIPVEARSALFLPFDRVGKSARGSLALDLPLASVIATRMGGAVRALDDARRTIELILPRAE